MLELKLCINYVYHLSFYISYQELYHVSAFPDTYLTFPGGR